jgi:hypothetical protein
MEVSYPANRLDLKRFPPCLKRIAAGAMGGMRGCVAACAFEGGGSGGGGGDVCICKSRATGDRTRGRNRN